HQISIATSSSSSLVPPLTDNKNLRELVKNALSNIDSNILKNNCNKSKDGRRLLESAWQVELYRTIYDHLPENVTISVEVGKLFTNDGVLDLYIPELQYAIEILIDGSSLQEHYNRFEKGI
ncbi:9231_t:CDS:1, partial [Ambispora leptoticha]